MLSWARKNEVAGWIWIWHIYALGCDLQGQNAKLSTKRESVHTAKSGNFLPHASQGSQPLDGATKRWCSEIVCVDGAAYYIITDQCFIILIIFDCWLSICPHRSVNSEAKNSN